MKKIETSVIIPNWNGKELLSDCLHSLSCQSYADFEIIVVDNGSTDGSVEYLKTVFPKVQVISLDKNYGFAKAINEGVNVSLSAYVVFLNNDTQVDKDWLKNLVATAKKYTQAISISSKLLNFYDHKIIDGVGILINEVGQARSIGWKETDEGQYEDLTYIFGATGGAALFKRDDFIKVGMFDENYFMYSEEVDFAFRAQFLGYKSVCCLKAVVYHKHKATSSKRPQHLEYWQFKNMTQTIIKDFPTTLILKDWRWLKILLVHLNTVIYQLKNGYIWPPMVTEAWLILHLPQLLWRRHKIQSSKKVSDEYIEQFLQEKKITFFGTVKKGF